MSTGRTAHFYFRRLAFSTPSSLRHKVLLLGRGYQAHAYTLHQNYHGNRNEEKVENVLRCFIY
jgi:hypothetical protein